MASHLIVVIPTAGRPELLRRTLDSLSRCRKPSIYRETVVIENGPKNGVEDVVKGYQTNLRARYVYETLGNKSHALNQVLECTKDCLIFFTDDDVRIHPETLCAYTEAATGIDGGQFYGGHTGVDYEQDPPEWLKPYLPHSAKGLNLGPDRKFIQEELKPFLGCNWAAFANDLVCLGGFNPDLGPGSPIKSTGQELDMHLRLFEHGIQQVNVPKAMVWHYVPTGRCSPRWTIHRAYRQGVASGYFYGTREGPPKVLQFRMLRTWVKRLAKVIRTALCSDRKARFHALYRLARQSGRIQGVRKSRKHHSL